MDKYNSTTRVQLPGWDEEHPFEVVLRRPSLLTMAAEGSIPNELIGAAQRLFCEGYDTSLPLDQLGRLLSPADDRILYGLYDHLALPPEVIHTL